MSVKEDGLSLIVTGLCLDFDRREKGMHDEGTNPRTAMEYAYLNQILRGAAEEIVGEEWRIFLREIGERRGYAKSDTAYSETYYKKMKAEVTANIRRRLHLSDK